MPSRCYASLGAHNQLQGIFLYIIQGNKWLISNKIWECSKFNIYVLCRGKLMERLHKGFKYILRWLDWGDYLMKIYRSVFPLRRRSEYVWLLWWLIVDLFVNYFINISGQITVKIEKSEMLQFDFSYLGLRVEGNAINCLPILFKLWTCKIFPQNRELLIKHFFSLKVCLASIWK